VLIPLAGNATLRNGVVLYELGLFEASIANRSEVGVGPPLGYCIGVMTTALGVSPCAAYRAAEHDIGAMRLGNLDAEHRLRVGNNDAFWGLSLHPRRMAMEFAVGQFLQNSGLDITVDPRMYCPNSLFGFSEQPFLCRVGLVIFLIT
jgi:hypothetical protein